MYRLRLIGSVLCDAMVPSGEKRCKQPLPMFKLFSSPPSLYKYFTLQPDVAARIHRGKVD
jgi:hypothetical protein